MLWNCSVFIHANHLLLVLCDQASWPGLTSYLMKRFDKNQVESLHHFDGSWQDCSNSMSYCSLVLSHRFVPMLCIICIIHTVRVIVVIILSLAVYLLQSQWASCQICEIAGMPGTFSPTTRLSDPDMHHGTCLTHLPWCMPGSLTSSFLWSR